MAEENDAGEQRWAKLARRRGLPSFIRRYAERRWTVIDAQSSERIWGRSDLDDNRDTRIPDGEHVGMPASGLQNCIHRQPWPASWTDCHPLWQMRATSTRTGRPP